MRYCKDPRIKNNLGIAVSVVDGNSESDSRRRTLHMTEDVSRNGLRFRHEHPLPVDSVIRILVVLDAPAQMVSKLGRVRWSQPHGEKGHAIGVELTSVTSLDGIVWNSFVMGLQQSAAA